MYRNRVIREKIPKYFEDFIKRPLKADSKTRCLHSALRGPLDEDLKVFWVFLLYFCLFIFSGS